MPGEPKPADAEDATQETFLKAYQSLNALRDPGRFGAWLSIPDYLIQPFDEQRKFLG